MVELKLEGYVRPIQLSDVSVNSFEKPMIFYLTNKEDTRSFFITFVIIDFQKKQIQYINSFSEENVKIINSQPNSKIFKIDSTPHCSLTINNGEDFLTFMDEEEFFVYVNLKKMIMRVYTINDLIKNNDIVFKNISATFYKDEDDTNYFYLSAVDSTNLLHIFRAPLTLESIEEIDSFPSHASPPHVLRKLKTKLLLSHEFKFSKFQTQENGKILTEDELGVRVFTNVVRNLMQRNEFKAAQNIGQKINPKEILSFIREKYPVKCMPGKILMIDMDTKEKTYYDTTGGSPAHFEVDNNAIYTSSHNFVRLRNNGIFYLEPAVIDKFILNQGKLELAGSFSHPKGFRYTTHKIFHNNNKTYICVFGHPNRLMFIDAEKMELLFYKDIGESDFTDETDMSIYMLPRFGGEEFVAVETSEDGEKIIFAGMEYIYFFNFANRDLYEVLNYKNFEIEDKKISLDDYMFRTAHFSFLD